MSSPKIQPVKANIQTQPPLQSNLFFAYFSPMDNENFKVISQEIKVE